LFALPTNTAFKTLSANTADFLKSDEGAVMLASILHSYHVARGSVTSDFVVDGAMVATVEGEMVIFAVLGNIVVVNGATIVDPDLLASPTVLINFCYLLKHW
jgi:uncharacterized surface protein with fasciclin (FAS1) repeats